MVSSDTVVGIVGAVILTGAMIAVFYYENSNADDGAADIGTGASLYTYRFNQTSGEETFNGVSAAPNAPWEQDVPIPAYTFSINVTVTWTDDGSPAVPAGQSMDTLSLEVRNETAQPGETVQGATGTLTISHSHNDTMPPQTLRVAADSPEEADQALQANLSAVHGAGNWTLIVTFVNGGASPLAAQVDTAGNFDVVVEYQYHRPERQE